MLQPEYQFAATGNEEDTNGTRATAGMITGGPTAVPTITSTVTLHDAGAGVAKLHFGPGYVLADFTIAPDGFGGTNVTHHP